MYHFELEREVARQKGRLEWYQKYINKILDEGKERKDIDCMIELASELQKVLNSPKPKPKLIPMPHVEPFKTNALMKPIEPETLNILYGCPDNLGSEKYLKARCKKKVEDRYYLRLSTNWDYGWELKKSIVTPRDVNYGRCAIIKDSFYRTKNLAPDPPYYNEPTMGDHTFCK